MGSEDDIKAVGALFAKYASITTADDAASRIKDIVTALHAAHVTSASAADATADKSASSSGKYNPDGPKAQKERTPEQQARKDRQALARAEAQQRRLAARILAREPIAATAPAPPSPTPPSTPPNPNPDIPHSAPLPPPPPPLSEKLELTVTEQVLIEPFAFGSAQLATGDGSCKSQRTESPQVASMKNVITPPRSRGMIMRDATATAKEFLAAQHKVSLPSDYVKQLARLLVDEESTEWVFFLEKWYVENWEHITDGSREARPKFHWYCKPAGPWGVEAREGVERIG